MSAKKTRTRVWVTIVVVVVVIIATVAATKARSKDEVKPDGRTAKAEFGDVQVKVTEVGTVQPEVKVDVKSPVSGKVIDLYVRDGDIVKKGQLLARVEPDLAQAQSLANTKNDLSSAEIRFNEARKGYDADHQLFAQGLLSTTQNRESETRYLSARQEFEAAREKYKIVESSGIPIHQSAGSFQGSNITAPMSGLVLTKNVEVGETVTSGVSSFNAGTILFTVADTSSMIIKAGVNEVDIGKIHASQPVKVTLDAYPKVSFAGKISRIAPAVRVDDKARVFDVEIRLDAQGKELRSGMTANIEVVGDRKQHVLTVPVEALFQKDEGEVVYIPRALDPKDEKKKPDDKSSTFDKDAWKTRFDRRIVTTGLSDNSKVEIAGGLKVGEQVALEDPTVPHDKKNDDD